MPQPNDDMLAIEVAWATPDAEVVIALRLPRGTTALQAIEQSGLMQRIREIDLAKNKIGIFGKLVSPDHVLHQHDRVEIYRPLSADPKEIRRLRANRPARQAK